MNTHDDFKAGFEPADPENKEKFKDPNDESQGKEKVTYDFCKYWKVIASCVQIRYEALLTVLSYRNHGTLAQHELLIPIQKPHLQLLGRNPSCKSHWHGSPRHILLLKAPRPMRGRHTRTNSSCFRKRLTHKRRMV
jgi:hypothetical protein